MTSQTTELSPSQWRGVIARDFTFSAVRRTSAAIAWSLKTQTKSPAVLVGYDNRFFSDDFARTVAAVLQREGCRVVLCRQQTPAPAIAYEVWRGHLGGAINITAGHKPSDYSGLTFLGSDATRVSPQTMEAIESRAAGIEDPGGDEHASKAREFETHDLHAGYLARLAELVRFDTIRAAKLRLAYDAMHGCGSGWLDRLLAEQNIACTAIRTSRDVLFDGSAPDPLEDNLCSLRKLVVTENAVTGLATDGDARGFGILDSDGSFISAGHVLGLLADYLIETRGWKSRIARTVATSHLLDGVAQHHGLALYETPAGFRHVAESLRGGKAAIAADGRGGLTIESHVHEKDGILACLLVAEMIAARSAPLSQQLRDLFHRIGREFWPVRLKFALSDEAKLQVEKRLAENFSNFAGHRVNNMSCADGCKLLLEGGSWLLIRPSKTKSIVRIYAEASSSTEAKQLAEEAREWINR